jgi:septal ring factor EnvC (AmiA/AmiB activator)
MIAREFGQLAHEKLRRLAKTANYSSGRCRPGGRDPRPWLVLIWSALAGLALSPGALAQSDEEQALEQVRARIGTVERRLAAETARRADQAAELKRLELSAAQASGELERLRAEGEAQRARRRELDEESRRAAASLAGERDALAQQVRLSYMTGREELFKLLLSQESPASLGRMLVYYDYLNRARAERIGTVATRVRTLAELAAESAALERELAASEAAQQREVKALDAARTDRGRLVAELDQAIATSGSEMENLRDEEQRLTDLLTELGELLAGFPVNTDEPFASLKGRLAWPARGRLVGDFGRLRGSGPIRWNGVLLETDRGTPVRAIYHGRVAFSDWLPGLGLLMVVDHGEGYMSLYGYNQVLLKESGDWVETGEAIGRVGDTGGQAKPSLYFEIRRNGEPENPHGWISADLPEN